MNQELGRALIVFGVIVTLAGVLILVAGKIPFLGKLPGDIVVRKGGFTLYAPIMTGIILSLLLTLALNLWARHR